MSDMRYLSIPLLAIVFALGFAYTALAAEENRVCTMEYAPVCAAHQVQCVRAPCYPVYETYSNACMAGDSPIIHQGECTGKETGPIKPAEPYTPPKGCVAWFDGCNSCSKAPNGQTMCTLRACQIGNTTPGKCTAYETVKPAPHATSTQSPPATATSSNPSDYAFESFPQFESPQPHQSWFERILIWLDEIIGFTNW